MFPNYSLRFLKTTQGRGTPTLALSCKGDFHDKKAHKKLANKNFLVK